MLLPAADHLTVTVNGSYLDAAPWMRLALDYLDAQAAAARPSAAAPTASTLAPMPIPTTGPDTTPSLVEASLHFDTVDFGDNQLTRQMQAVSRLVHGQPVSATFQIANPTGRSLQAELDSPAPGALKLGVTIGDAATWVRIFTGPWHTRAPAPGQFGTVVSQLIKVPSMVAGGDVTATADVRFADPEWLQGHLRLTHGTMIRPPFLLRALALKTGRQLQASPLIEELVIDHLALGPSYVDVSGFSLKGSGFINNLKVKTGHHDYVSDKLSVEGTYFGVGFEVSGTLAKPFVGLSDKNVLIRALGQKNENEFFNPEEEPAKPK